MEKATRSHTKEHNARLVLKTIYEGAGISRADIARSTNLTRPTVSALVAELLGQPQDLLATMVLGNTAATVGMLASRSIQPHFMNFNLFSALKNLRKKS